MLHWIFVHAWFSLIKEWGWRLLFTRFLETRTLSILPLFNARHKKSQNKTVLKAYLKKDEIIIEMSQNFKKNLKKEYAADHTWNKILQKLQTWKTSNDITNEINFIIQNELLYYFSSNASRRLVISFMIKKNLSDDS